MAEIYVNIKYNCIVGLLIICIQYQGKAMLRLLLVNGLSFNWLPRNERHLCVEQQVHVSVILAQMTTFEGHGMCLVHLNQALQPITQKRYHPSRDETDVCRVSCR